MRKLTAVFLILLMALIVLAVKAMDASGKQERVCWHHEAQGVADQSWTKWMPVSALNGHQGHVGDHGVNDGSECGDDALAPIVPDPTPVAIGTAVPPGDEPESAEYKIYLPNVPNACSYDGSYVQLCDGSVIPFDVQH